MCCFFFEQKTAYEMRISDWSSDVCSSDLQRVTEYRRKRDRIAGMRDAVGRHQAAAEIPEHRFGISCKEAMDRETDRRGEPLLADFPRGEIGSASCRDRVCKYVSTSVGAVALQNKKSKQTSQSVKE